MHSYVVKTIVLGEGGIGKTSLIRSFMNETLSKDYKMTIGVDLFSKTVEYNKDQTVTFSVNDVAGQKRFAELKNLFIRGTQMSLLVFDLTRKDTLINLVNNWIAPLMELCPDTINILIGNKTDLEDLRVITQKEGIETLKKLRKNWPKAKFLDYIETSAIMNENVNYSFDLLGKEFLKSLK